MLALTHTIALEWPLCLNHTTCCFDTSQGTAWSRFSRASLAQIEHKPQPDHRKSLINSWKAVVSCPFLGRRREGTHRWSGCS